MKKARTNVKERSSAALHGNTEELACSLSFAEIHELFRELQQEKPINFQTLCDLCSINPKILNEQERGKLRLLQLAFELLMAAFELSEKETASQIGTTD